MRIAQWAALRGRTVIACSTRRPAEAKEIRYRAAGGRVTDLVMLRSRVSLACCDGQGRSGASLHAEPPKYLMAERAHGAVERCSHAYQAVRSRELLDVSKSMRNLCIESGTEVLDERSMRAVWARFQRVSPARR